MSRVLGIIKNDMYFQRRTGIYLLYLMLTILYLAVLHAIPADLKKVVAELLILPIRRQWDCILWGRSF